MKNDLQTIMQNICFTATKKHIISGLLLWSFWFGGYANNLPVVVDDEDKKQAYKMARWIRTISLLQESQVPPLSSMITLLTQLKPFKMPTTK